MKDYAWLHDLKADLADWINTELHPDQLRVIFDPSGPYLAQQHVGKGTPKKTAHALMVWNKSVRMFNRLVRDNTISFTEALGYKTQISLSPNALEELSSILSEIKAEAEPENYPDAFEKFISGSGATKRTVTGPYEQTKRQLREAYRQSILARQAYRKATDSVERQIYSAKIRGYSATIDCLKQQLGYSSDPATSARRQQIWTISRQAREHSDARWAEREIILEKKEVAWEAVVTAKNNLKHMTGWHEWDPDTESYRHYSGTCPNDTARILDAQLEADSARRAYRRAKAEAAAYVKAVRLESEYRTFALRLAGDSSVPLEEVDRARQRYLAAIRRLAEPTPETVRELQHQLSDLKRSHQIRMDKLAASQTKQCTPTRKIAHNDR